MEAERGGGMQYQNIFRRYELKYLLTPEQKARVLAVMEDHMALDKYGRTTIRNLYLDTDHYRLIRRSIEKPTYKEKLRIRSYSKALPGQPVFVELKKKYKGVVYKRRLAMPEQDALDWLLGGSSPPNSQIGREIDYFRSYYGDLTPKVFLSYDREAYYSSRQKDFRVTFDDKILCRREALSLNTDPWGEPILDSGLTLMEIKTAGGMPLWMTDVLTREQIYKASYSKYGTAYEKQIFKEVFVHA